MLRSILSVVAGVVVWGILWASAGLGLASAMPASFDENGVTTEPLLLLVFIVVAAALSILAGWLCATIAKHSLMKHVTVLAFIQLAIGISVQAGVWTLMPLWYHVIFLSIVVPMHILGGRLRAARAGAVAARGAGDALA